VALVERSRAQKPATDAEFEVVGMLISTEIICAYWSRNLNRLVAIFVHFYRMRSWSDPYTNRFPQAQLGVKTPALRWFFEPAAKASADERAFLYGQLIGSPIGIVMGSLCALMVIGAAMFRSGAPIFYFFAISELLLITARMIDWRRRNLRLKNSPGTMPDIDGSVLLSVLWCTQQGALAFIIMTGHDLVLTVLSTTLVMAMIGPICARNYAAPRFAFVLVLLCDLPFVAGALFSAEPWLSVILPMTPAFLLGAMHIIGSFHRSMLMTLAMRAKALHLAQHDALTGILNRQGLDDALSQMDAMPDKQMAILCIDLDGFKAVNDQHGHGAGDVLLIEVANRLKEQLRPEDWVARMGGDEFMVVVRGMEPDKVGPLADRLISAVSRHIYTLEDGTELRVGASIGFACLPEDAASTVELRLRADQALYAAKNAGKGVGRRYGMLAASAPPLNDLPKSNISTR
tara:strand:+ start:125644 stop:127020 length:1377 start_codon:yes stop_codon:yes gene_type:complete